MINKSILPKKEDIQAIACDLDGTLLSGFFSIHPKNKEVILKIRNDYPNLPIIIATGRDYYSSEFVREELNLGCFPSVNLQGALVCLKDDDVMIDATFSASQVFRVVERFSKEKRLVILEVDGFYIIASNSPDNGFFEKLIRENTHISVGSNFIKYNEEKIQSGELKVKRIFLPYKDGQEDSTRDMIKSIHDDTFAITSSTKYFYEVIPCGFNKANGIRLLCSHLGISMEKIIAFGDALNDLEMLSEVGYGVAMDNAFSLVKGVAKYIAPPNDEGGVGLVLEKIFYGD